MVELMQMFLFLFKSKYRRKWSWFSPFLCSVLIVLLFCHEAVSKCSVSNCVNGVCKNDTCACFEGWQGPECQYCGGKIKLTSPSGFITDGPGNYSVSIQCTWLLSPERNGPDPPPIRVRLESFATECGWDHLYVYDGDSVRAETMLAVFSGVLNDGESSWTRQVVARSGRVLVHFFSDDAYAMEGFNLTYAAYSCPSDSHYTNCSNHGVCDSSTGACTCDDGWTGIGCDRILCPHNCHSEQGYGKCTQLGCVCSPSKRGESCLEDTALSGWDRGWAEVGEGGARPNGNVPTLAGHTLLYYEGSVIAIAGEGFGKTPFMYRYRIEENTWEEIEIHGESPQPRYLHSAVLYKDEVIVYGGRLLDGDGPRGGLAGLEGRAGDVTNELWRIKLQGNVAFARNATPTACGHRAPPLGHCGGLQVSGHSGALVWLGATRRPVMLALFGHSPHYGYLHIVQEYYIEEEQWAGGEAGAGSGAGAGWARGGFAHSATWDPLSRRVLVHAGLLADSEAAQSPSNMLHEYDPETRVWRPLPAAPCARYLHSASLLSPGVILVFGGNTHNDSAIAAVSSVASCRCYSDTAAIYNVRCKTWTTVESPGTARAAHASVLVPGRTPRVMIHGGFDGRLRSDALMFSAGGRCETHNTEHSCVHSVTTTGRACVWTEGQTCVPLEEVGWEESHKSEVRSCVAEPILEERRCLVGDTCTSCVAAQCVWCGACYSSAAYCAKTHRRLMATQVSECVWSGGIGGEARARCSRYHSCTACHAHRSHHARPNEDPGPRLCYWDYDSVKCRPANSTEDTRTTSHACTPPCSTYQSCANCTAEECIWCASADKCVDKNAYGATFPLGGCRLWSTATGPGSSGTCGAGSGSGSGCAIHQACSTCRTEPACGWCDDGAGTGSGVCLPGSADRPHNGVCPAQQWHFTSCPACQCNGHSYCDTEGRCVQPCGGRALGEHCQHCAPQHWGSPLNSRSCQPCECNDQAITCAVDTGRCYCSTKGLSGDRCDKCDTANHYHGDAINKGACYYDLAVDYQFTFNLSKKEDRHLSAINFRNSPVKADVDADFSITCSSHAKMNLTVRTKSAPNEKILYTQLNCTNFRTKFTKNEHAFGIEDNVTLTTFFVYVYDFKPPLWIQISFSQYPKLNLQQFFITFSSCFLLLLLLAAALWKIKQKYDMYRRRQRLFVEMEQMASRPFSQVCVELERFGNGETRRSIVTSPSTTTTTGVPAPVALEPCRDGRAAVLSLLVRLPCGGARVAPAPGGLALASALVSLGHRPSHVAVAKITRHQITPNCK